MIGVDEVGRGAWAGPLLVVAARKKPHKRLPQGLTDSKQLTERRRKELFPKIIDACDIGEGWVSADVIDQLGLAQALQSATMLAVFSIDAKTHENILIDGRVDFLKRSKHTHVRTKPKADVHDPIVSAASVVAKVLRDQLMSEYAVEYPDYAFEQHVGYGTKKHQAALKKNGITRLHRKSFAPIAAIL